MRKSLIGFGVVSGLAAAVVVAPYFIDWNWFKPQLVAAVEEATGFEVEVAGDIGFSLLPSPRLSAEGLTVRGFGPATEPLVTAERLSAAVAFLPLLSKRAEVKYVALETPMVRLVDYPDGTSNWKDPAKAESESAGGALSIEDFRIENGTFVMVGTDGDATEVTDIDVAVAIASVDGPYALAGTLTYGALPVEIDANVSEDGAIKLEADLADAAHVDFNGQLGKAEGDAPTPVSGRLAVRGERLGAILAAFAEDGDEPRAPAYRLPFRMSAAVRGSTDRIRLTGVGGEVAGGKFSGEVGILRGDRTAIDGRLALTRLDLAEWQDEEERGDGEPFELPEAIDAEIGLRIADARFGDMRFGSVNAPISLANRVLSLGNTVIALAAGGAATLSGTLDAHQERPRFRGRFDARLPRPAQTLAALGIDGYASLPPLMLAGGVGYSGEVLALGNVRGSFGGKPVTGSLTYPLADEKPMRVDLAAASLNLDRMVAKEGTAGREGEARPVQFNVRLGELLSGGKAYGGISAAGLYSGDRVTLTNATVRQAMGLGITAKGSIDDISGARTTDLAVSLAGDGVSGAVTVKGPLAQMDVGGAVTYAGARIGVDGWVKTEPATAFELTATAAAPEAGAVLARLRDEPGGARLGPLDLSMRIVGSGDAVRVSNIAGKVGSMTLAGDASINTAGTVPAVNATLRAGTVPVLALMGDDGTGAQEAARGGERWSAEPLSFDWIRSFDGRIAFSAERAVYDTYVIDKPSTVLVNRGDTLTIENFKGAMYGGGLSVTGAMKAGASQGMALKLALNDVPVEPFLKASMATAPATGMLDLAASVTASGRSQRALMGSLAGPVRIAATNGVIRKVDLKKLDEEMDDLRSVNSLVRFAGGALSGGETRYRTLSIDATGRSGRFTIDRMTSDMDGGSMTATGYVDLGQWFANAVATFRLGSHEDAPAIPATIKGDLPVPAVTYSLAPLTTWFGKRLALVGIRAATGEDKLDIGGLLGVRRPQPATPGVTEGAAPSGEQAAAPKARPRTVEEELGGVLGQLLGRKRKAEPAPPEDGEPQPADIGGPN